MQATMNPSMTFKAVLTDEARNINDAIKHFFNTRTHTPGDAFVDTYYEMIENYILAGGKRLRPFLLVQTYKGLAKKFTKEIYRPSLSVEFLHNASLIHDDIIDRDDTRRGNPAFHYMFKNFYDDHGYQGSTPSHFGNTMGILGGDTTFFLGLEALQTSFPSRINEKVIALYCQAYHQICDGVLMEMNFINLPEVSVSQYLKMIELKTGALIEKSLLMGATFAQASREIKEFLSSFAINLGKAFQLKDDVLGSFGDEKITGKPSDGDIKDGKKTMLLLKSLDSASGTQLTKLGSIIGDHSATRENVDEVRSIFKDTGALDYCMDQVRYFSDLAIKALTNLEDHFHSKERGILADLVSYNLHREK